MTPKEKYQDIDASASVLPEKAIINLQQLKPILFDKKYQTEEYSDTRKKAEEKMNAMYDKIYKDYPDAIKSKVAKQPEPKTPQAIAQKAAKQTIKQPTVKNPKATAGATKRGNVTKLAKEIRKDGETWHAAMKRAGEMINKEKGKAVKKANVQYEKLKAFLAKNPSIEKTMVTYGKKPNQGTRPLDVKRDAARIAKPKGKRVSSEGKTYYEYRANRTDSSRKRYPYLELGGKLFGAGYFAKGGYLPKGANYKSYTAKGENYEYRNFFGIEQSDFEKIVDVWHEHEKNHSQYASIYNKTISDMQAKYGSDTIDAVISHIEDVHNLHKMYNEDYYAKGGEFGHTFNGAGKFAKGGKTNNGHNLPNTVEEYFATMNDFSMKLGEAEANFANDNGASYQKLLAERDEFFEKVKAKWYAELNEAEGNFAKDGGKSYEAALKKLEDARFRFAKGGIIDVTIDEVRENGEFMDSYMIDESQTVSNAGEQESWLYKGKNYLITVWNSRAVEHYDGQEEIDIDEDYGSYAKGGKTKSKTYKVKIYSTDYRNTFIMEKTFTNEKAAVYFAYSVDDMNDDGFYYNVYGLDANGKKLIKVYGLYEHVDDDSDEVADEDYIKKHPKYKDCVSWQVDMRVASYPTNKTIMTKTFDTLRKAVKLVDTLENEPLYSLINGEFYDEYEHDYFAKGGKTKSYSKYVVRKELLDENTSVPVGDTYVSDGVYEGRYNDDGTFEIKMKGKWHEAESIDWEKYAKGGEITPKVNAEIVKRAEVIYANNNGSTKEDFDRAYHQAIREAGYNVGEFISTMKNIGADYGHEEEDYYAKGGKVKGRLSDTHKYVPNRMIQEIEVERRGKTSFIDGADILDGVYVKKGVKFADGGLIRLKIKNLDAFDKYYDEVGYTLDELSLPLQDKNKVWYSVTNDKSIADGLIKDGYVELYTPVMFAHGGTMPHIHSKKHRNG